MRLGHAIYRNKESIIKNTIVWFLVFVLVALPFGIEIAAVLVIPLIIPVHVNYFLVDKYMKKKMYIQYGIYALALVIVFGFIAQGLFFATKYSTLVPIFSVVPIPIPEPIEGIIDDITIDVIPTFKFAFNPLIAIILTTLFKHFQEKQQNIIQELETQKLKAELDFLKGQVNPHFLFNTLNNLFSMSSTYGDEATANGIGHLSHLMRYMLYDTNSEFVRLENEIDMLENFIDLQKLRMDINSTNSIEFIVKGDTNKKQIPPMLLIPFVENAFKHGYSVNNEYTVKIELLVVEDGLTFVVENTINKTRESKNLDSSGIGLENIRKRLELLYKDEYLLEIIEKENKHYISLKIPFIN
ncbi:sensor histidine kinase [Bacteroidota bacterium]